MKIKDFDLFFCFFKEKKLLDTFKYLQTTEDQTENDSNLKLSAELHSLVYSISLLLLINNKASQAAI